MTKEQLLQENQDLKHRILALEAELANANFDLEAATPLKWPASQEVVPEAEEAFVNCPHAKCNCVTSGFEVPARYCVQQMLPKDPIERINAANERDWHELQRPEPIEESSKIFDYGPRPSPETPITWESLIRLIGLLEEVSEDEFDAMPNAEKGEFIKSLILGQIRK